MVLYVVSLQVADLHGIASLAWQHPDVDICMTVRNPLDQEQVRERVILERQGGLHKVGGHSGPGATEHHRHQHPKHLPPPCHLHLTWPGNTKEVATLRVLTPDQAKEQYNVEIQTSMSEAGERIPMLALQCENLEPVALHLLGEEFVVTPLHDPSQQYTQLEWDNNGDTPCNWETYDMANGSIRVSQLQAYIQ